MQGPEPETSREVRRVINAIHDLSELESQIPLCKTIDEVEEIRARTMGIQTYGREHDDLGPVLIAWAKRCAVLCQLRITELQEIAKAKRDGRISNTTNSASEKVAHSNAKLVASLPPEELNKHLDKSSSIQLIARKVRKMRTEKEPKGSPEKRAKDLERYYRKKAENPRTPALKLSPAQKFERYWTQEKKLLQKSFSVSDLSSVETYWTREFHSYRKDEEDGKRERDIAFLKLRTTFVRSKDVAMNEAKKKA
jgi:hypothetical protein